jgi:hypothetical protein
MSSHHVVRDHQEPALLLLAPAPDLETLGQLLDWGSGLWVDEIMLEWASAHGVKPDAAWISPSAPMPQELFPDLQVFPSQEHLAEKIETIAQHTGQKKVTLVSANCLPYLQEISREPALHASVTFADNHYTYFFADAHKRHVMLHRGIQFECSPETGPFHWQDASADIRAHIEFPLPVRVLWNNKYTFETR